MSLIELDEGVTNLKTIVIYGAFDNSKLNKSERTALETLQVAASQLQALHGYTVLRVGIDFDSSLPFPFTVWGVRPPNEPLESKKLTDTVVEGPYSRLTIPPFISSRLIDDSASQIGDAGDVWETTAFVARDIWEFVDLFKKGLETHDQDLEQWADDMSGDLFSLASHVMENLKATLKTIEPPAASIKQDAA